MKKRSFRGFTLIELLIVIGIIGFLAAAILVAVDPVKRIQDARNSKRWSEVNSILNAILTKQVDDRSEYDGETGVGYAPIIDQTGDNVQVIVRDDSGIVCNSQAARPGCNKPMDIAGANKNCVANIGRTVSGDTTKLVPKYIAEIPFDPLGEGAATPCSGAGTAECSGAGVTLGDLVVGDTNTGYYLARTAGGRIEVGSCYPDQGATIMVKR